MLKTTLPSGLDLIVQPRHASKVVAAQVWVRVGSADESPEDAGLAHVHEHMLFKGTARRKVGEIAADVEAAGGDINAWTSFDQTVYHVTMPSRELDVALDILADAVQNSAFDADELERELEVVLDTLVAAGVDVRADRDQIWRDFQGWRVNYDVALITLAGFVNAPYAPWSSDRSLRIHRPSVKTLALQRARHRTR